MLLSAGEGQALPLSPEEGTMLDWNLEVDGPEVMTWGAVTASGAQLRVSTSYSSAYSWCVYTFQGWHVTGGYGDSIEDSQRKAEQAAARNGL